MGWDSFRQMTPPPLLKFESVQLEMFPEGNMTGVERSKTDD